MSHAIFVTLVLKKSQSASCSIFGKSLKKIHNFFRAKYLAL